MNVETLALSVIAALCIAAVGMIAYTVFRLRRGPVVYEEPMPWEHSDYHPPARMRVQADFIQKED